MNKQRKTSHILNVFQYDHATGIIGLNGAPVSGYGLYLTTNINDGSVGIDSSASINALYLLKNTTKQFEISYDTSGATKIFRLLPYQSASFFQIGNPSNAANSNSDYVFISESVYGNVLIGPGIGNAVSNLTGATASIHKVQFNGAVFANNSIQATSFKITGGASTGFLKADGTVDAVTYLSGNQSITVSGDATGSGTTSIALTLANTAVTPGVYGSTTLVPVVTVDSKGRITSVTTAAISGSLTFTGDVTGSGTTGTSTAMTLAASGVTAGTYTKVTVDSKGRVTVGASATTSDISEGTNLYYTDARVLSYLSANTYATQSYVNTQVSNLVAAAPATLDTLNELAAALGNDPSFATTISTALGNRLRVDINNQGLSATLQGYGRTNLGLGTAATSNTGDFVAYRTFGTAANSAIGDFVAYRTFGTAANNNTGDFALASHTHSIANVTGLQTALDGKQASGSYAASSHSHIISDVTGLQTALDGKQASLGFTPYNSTNPSGYISSYTETDTLATVTARGATTTIAIGSPNFYDTTGSYNVNLGSGGSEGRGLVAGYSGGSYGGIGYNVRHTTTGGSWLAPGTDTSSYVLFTAGGFVFYGAPSGAAGRSLSYITLGSFSNTGLFNAVNITSGGNQVWHVGNLTNLNQLSNGPGYITSITSGNVTTALGYTPYNSTNPSGYITSSALSSYLPLIGGTLSGNLYVTNSSTVGAIFISGAQVGARQYMIHNGITGISNSGLQIRDVTGNANLVYFDTGYNASFGAGIWATSGNFSAAISASNFSGSSSGTNTGDQTNISGTAGSISGYNNPTTSPTANTIMYRDGSGYVQAVYYYSSNAGRETTGINSLTGKVSAGAGYMYEFTAAAVQTFLGLGSLAYSSATIPTNNNQLTNGAGYITGYTETDTLASVTGRGATTTSPITINGGGTQPLSLTTTSGSPWHIALNRTDLGLTSRVFAHNSPYNGWYFEHNISIAGNTNIHSGNYNSYSPTLTGGGASGTWGISISGVSSQVSVNYNNDSNSTYQMLWGSGNSVYGTAGVYVNPSTDHVYANKFSSVYEINVYTVSGGDYLQITDNQVYRPNGGILYLNWSSNANVALTGPSGGYVGVGNNSPSYKMHVSGDIYANGGWLRVSGSQGLYFESYAGGWRMTDSSYIRSYNGKALSMEGASVDYVSSIYMNGGVYINTFNNRNLLVKSTGSSDAGILGRGSGDQFAFQVYGSGGDYGFLNSAWGAWDIRKSVGGSLYMNDNTSYYLNTTSNSYVYRLESATDLRAPIFYDSNDTGYYADFNSTSNSAMRVRGGTLYGPNPTWGRYLQVGGNGNQNTDYASVVTTDGNLHLDARAGSAMYLNYYSNGIIYLNGATYYISANGSQYNGNAATVTNGLYTNNYSGTLDGRYFFDYGFTTGYPGTEANAMPGNRSAFTYSNGAPLTGCIAHFGAAGYGIQLNGDYGGDSFSMRSRNGDAGTWRPWKRLLTDYNYNSYSPTLTGTGASGTWGISINGNAATASSVSWGNVSSKPASWLNETNLIIDNDPNTAQPSGFYQNYGSGNNPTGTWMNYVNVRHSNPGNVHGYQIGMSYYDNNLWFRSYSGGGTYLSWAKALSSQNFTSFVDAPNAVGNGNGYYNVQNWLQVNGSHGIFWPSYYSFHIRPNISSTYTQMEIIGGKNSYGGIYDNYSAVNGFMYDSAGNGGAYREANGRWYFYHHVGNNCTGISTSSTSSSYRAYIGGALYAEGDIVAYSDIRKKTDIVTIDNALDKVLQLRGVYYTRTDEVEKGRKTGVIAQEINEVLPEVVTYAADTDEYGVSYGNVVGVLIEAIKEQQLQIEELKNKLDNVLSSR